MILVAKNDSLKSAMHSFLKARGVALHRSEDFQAIGRHNVQGELLGVVAFNSFIGRVCSMHVAGDGNWVSRELIRATFDYPFRQLDLVAIITAIGAENRRSLKFATHMGFREVHRVQNGSRQDVDLIVLEMKREECKWLRSGKPLLVERKAA